MFKLFQFAQWVSASAVPKIINGEYYMTKDFDQTRSACLFFSITGFLLALIFYISFAINLAATKEDSELPLSLVVSD